MLFLLAPVCAEMARPSPGCGMPHAFFPTDGPHWHRLSVADPQGLGIISRDYVLDASTAAPVTDPIPLVLFFHGQTGDAMQSARGLAYGALGKNHGFAVAYPQGS